MIQKNRIMLYFVALSIYWLGFWCLYRLLLERERFFQLNRAYLLFTFALGLLLPLIPWESFLPTTLSAGTPVIWLQTINIFPENLAINPVQAHTSWLDYLGYAFMLGSSWALYRFCYNLVQLMRLILQGEITPKEGYYLVQHPTVKAPYSWLNFLFWNEQLNLSQAEQEAIITHEVAHIQQKHSWDLLFLELSKIVLWWNPLWYAYRRSLEETHEYLADSQALHSISKRDYGQLLLRQSLLHPQLNLVHTFHTSQLKKRIVMMTKSPSSLLALGKYVLFFPTLLILLLACEDAEAQQVPNDASQDEQEEPTFFELVDTVVTFDPSSLEEEVSFVKRRIYDNVEQMPIFGNCAGMEGDELQECSDVNLLTFIYQNVKYPKEAFEAKQEGMAVLQLVVNKNGEVINVQTVAEKTTEHQSLNDAALAVIKSLPDFQPGTQDGEPVNVQLVIPIRFKLN